MVADLTARAEEGRKKYGTYLESFNGRDALMDAYQESLDQTMYLRQAIEERDSVKARIDVKTVPLADMLVRFGFTGEELGYFDRTALEATPEDFEPDWDPDIARLDWESPAP